MPRTDIHTDAMLRHLGAAYYESLHGRATHADVTRALDTVEEEMGEQRPAADGGTRGSAHRAPGRQRDGAARRPHLARHPAHVGHRRPRRHRGRLGRGPSQAAPPASAGQEEKEEK